MTNYLGLSEKEIISLLIEQIASLKSDIDSIKETQQEMHLKISDIKQKVTRKYGQV
jgi:hypothetical protein